VTVGDDAAVYEVEEVVLDPPGGGLGWYARLVSYGLCMDLSTPCDTRRMVKL
jgi:hypothetical protein